MTSPRLVILSLAVTGLLGSVVACGTPSVEGSEIDNAAPSRSRSKSTKETKSTSVDDDSDDPVEQTQPGQGSTSQPQTTTPEPEPTPTPAPTTTTTTPPPTPPPVTQPACGGKQPLACLDCCLDANPGAIVFEDNYDRCIANCLDSACDDRCQTEHVQLCAGSDACTANHKCMEANGCLVSNYCNPL